MSVFLLGRYFFNEASFWDKSSFWVLDFLFGCQSSCWEDIFLIGLLSGASLPWGFSIPSLGVSLPAGFLISYLSFSLPVGAHFS